ncbi:zinc finger protein 862-like [Argopecten irradians]|uniref:zinc finger protein 862-like n=1 Tax=Argopecten irradians TaxID=31199 RepID=UPI0037100D18
MAAKRPGQTPLTCFGFKKSKPTASTADSAPDSGVKAKPSLGSKRHFVSAWLKEFSWLRYDNDAMFCKMCEENASMAGKTDFVSGNKSFKRETLVWHGNSKRHKDVRDSVIASKESGSTVTDNFERQRQQRDTKIMQDMHVKFVTAYTIAKEELPFTKFKPLLDMQRKNGLSEKISDSYNNDVKCAEMISCISEVMKEKLSSKLRDSMYFSVIIDAGTDASIKENEAMNVRYVEADGKPATKLLGLVELEHAHAEGTLQAINKAMNEAGFPEAIYQNHLVGFCADGASVNFGKVGGVQQKLRENIPWLIPIWCLPHRLELTVMNLLKKSTTAAAIMDILHLIYKTYHYSPKSRRELKSIGEELQKWLQCEPDRSTVESLEDLGV